MPAETIVDQCQRDEPSDPEFVTGGPIAVVPAPVDDVDVPSLGVEV